MLTFFGCGPDTGPTGGQSQPAPTNNGSDPDPSRTPSLAIASATQTPQVELFEWFSLTGIANDDKGSDIAESIVWTSNVDGVLGTGSVIVIPGLSRGPHLITAAIESLNLNDSTHVLVEEESQFQTRVLGTSGNDRGAALAIAPDRSFYLAGETTGNFTFGNIGKSDMFLHKLRRDGLLEWSAQTGSIDVDIAFDVAANGNRVAIVGSVQESTDGHEFIGAADAYLALFDPSDGRPIFSMQLGSDATDNFTGVAIAPDDSIYLIGRSSGGLFIEKEFGGFSPFAMKLDPDGNTIWAGQISGQGEFNDLVLDETGLVAVGATEGDLYGINAGVADAFITSMSLEGVELWTRQFGSNELDLFPRVAKHDGSTIVTFSTAGVFVDGAVAPPSRFAFDVAVIKFDADGIELWRKQHTFPERLAVTDIVAYDGGITITGFDRRPNGSSGGQVIFLSEDGDLLSKQTIGFGELDRAYSVGLYGGFLYVAGQFIDSVDGQQTNGLRDTFLKAIPLL